MSGPYSIGSTHWPGLSKLTEETGELLQVLGKLLGTGGELKHWDGSNLRDKLHEELGDLTAAIDFFAKHNGLDETIIGLRAQTKLAQFERWHDGD